MNFNELKNYLLQLFNTRNFQTHFQNQNLHAEEETIFNCTNGSSIKITFPGYKSRFQPNRTAYDYKVVLCKQGLEIPLSHTNIITDLYNKVNHGNMNVDNLCDALIHFFQTGVHHFNSLDTYLPYNQTPPSQNIINRVLNAHNGRNFDSSIHQYDLTLEELFLSIKLISLQEDINYPISNGYEGRKMPLYRYIEALYTTSPNSQYSLEDVIQRTLQTSNRPVLWTNQIDYSFNSSIV